MKAEECEGIQLCDFEPSLGDFREDLLTGLRNTPKTIPCKYFYDGRGSWLFDRICELDEYYPTRTERAILEENVGEMAKLCGPNCLLVELGSGSSIKTRLLLDRLEEPVGYMPLDISRPHLLEAARGLSRDYPWLNIRPVCADYTEPLALPIEEIAAERKVLFFPGSTIGNFRPSEACTFLRQVGCWCEAGDAMILGVDLVKDHRVLERAYNDSKGVTAAFNLNLLHRANEELGANFEVENFRHEAIFNPLHNRIEMHLVSEREQRVEIAQEEILFREGERVVTEYSYKYRIPTLREMVRASGWQLSQSWLDEKRWFSVHYLEKLVRSS